MREYSTKKKKRYKTQKDVYIQIIGQRYRTQKINISDIINFVLADMKYIWHVGRKQSQYKNHK